MEMRTTTRMRTRTELRPSTFSMSSTGGTFEAPSTCMVQFTACKTLIFAWILSSHLKGI